MEFFSYLRDALTGKIYKKNILLGENINKLYKKARQLPDESFIKRWVIACIFSISGNLKEFFFGKKGESINVLKKNLDILNIDKVYEIIKILVCYYISATEKAQIPSKFLKEIELEQKDFEDEIFLFFAFNNEDIETFRELYNIYKNDHTVYANTIYRKIVERVFGIKGTDSLYDLYKKLGNKFSPDIREILYLQASLTAFWISVFNELGVFDNSGDMNVFYNILSRSINEEDI